MLGRMLFGVSVVVLAGAYGPAVGAGRSAGKAPPVTPQPAGYLAPLPEPLRVLRGFDPPATQYGPGHLGVDLRAAPRETVRTAGAGVVRFAGPVAGRGVVVVAHAAGISTEYEPVRATIPAGTAVRAGQVIGVLRGRHAGCPGSCLHWGARRGTTYINPLDLLRPLGPVVLLPWADAAKGGG